MSFRVNYALTTNGEILIPTDSLDKFIKYRCNDCDCDKFEYDSEYDLRCSKCGKLIIFDQIKKELEALGKTN